MSIEKLMVTLAGVTVKNVMGLEEKMIRLMREIRLYRYPGERNSGHRLKTGVGVKRETHRCCGQCHCCAHCHNCGVPTEEKSEIISGHVIFKTITEYLKKKDVKLRSGYRT